jgi:hypothetical protein
VVNLFCRRLALCAGVVLGLSAAVQGGVNLQFTAVSVTVNPSVTRDFDVTLNMTGNGEQVLGLDYYFKALGLADGHFQIKDRRIGLSSFNDPINEDPIVESSSNGDNLLNPQNEWDLGAVAASAVTSSTTARLVAAYTLSVLPGTPNGSYVIESIGPSGSSGWFAPDFQDQGFTNNASINVLVVPEPAAVGVIGLVGLIGIQRKSRNA